MLYVIKMCRILYVNMNKCSEILLISQEIKRDSICSADVLLFCPNRKRQNKGSFLLNVNILFIKIRKNRTLVV